MLEYKIVMNAAYKHKISYHQAKIFYLEIVCNTRNLRLSTIRVKLDQKIRRWKKVNMIK